MKFQRTSSQPNVIVLEGYSEPHESWLATLWQRMIHHVSLNSIWTYLAKFADCSSDPIIRERCDRQGNSYYIVYDPVTQQQSICASEAEIRAWLEQRYYLSVPLN